MVRKSSPSERIEKVVKRKRTNSDLNSLPETANPPSAKKDVNSLNAQILKLYKKQVPAGGESSVSQGPTEEFLKNEDKREHKRSRNVENSKITKEKIAALAVKHSSLTFSDVGGLDKVLSAILDLFLHLRDPELFTELGLQPKCGFLLHGPPGCGKTHLARATAGEVGIPYIEVTATELVCGISGESESRIRDMFDDALKSAPCILFIDEIDAVSSKRETTERGMEKRMVTQLLKCLDELKTRDVTSSVMVIGATNRPDSIDPALRRGGRFDVEFAIGMPDENARLKILQVLCKKLKLAPEFDMQWLAHHTPGYLGADLENLITTALNVGVKRIYKKIITNYIAQGEGDSTADSSLLPMFDSVDSELTLDAVRRWFKSKWKIPKEEMIDICFQQQDFQVALQSCIPYSKREGFATVPDVTWEDVGALEDIKKTLQRAIIRPIKYAKLYESAYMTRGILLYGPKGCGKTLLAKAIANECSINFLSVKGPELLGMYLGESEKAVRQCFQRARNSAPCVIFFDEIDALCPTRSGSNVNAAAERVVNQLLTEMDGMEERKQVFVIGATNRLEIIDSAMLRPGRLEKIVYVGLPSPTDRVEILKSLTKNKTHPKISDNVDLEQLGQDSRCDNFSGADLAYLVRAAFSEALEDHISLHDPLSDEKVVINNKHFELAFNEVKPSVSEKDRKYFQRNPV